MAQSPNNKEPSMLSTGMHTAFQTARTGAAGEQQRPQTASLPYSKKPLPKQKAKWNQSSSTWRHSTREQSFSREKRFRTALPYSLDLLTLDITARGEKRAASFGSGKKCPISEVTLRNAKEKPGPEAYDVGVLTESTRSPAKGRTFGEAWDKYKKVYIDHRKDVYSCHLTEENPPQKYTIQQPAGKSARAFTAYGRQKMYSQLMADSQRYVPGPHYYPADRNLYTTIGFTSRSFTSGKRIDLSAPANNNPGSQYNLLGFCDKFGNTRKKNLPQ